MNKNSTTLLQKKEANFSSKFEQPELPSMFELLYHFKS